MGSHGTVHTNFAVVANSRGPMCLEPQRRSQRGAAWGARPRLLRCPEGRQAEDEEVRRHLPDCGFLVLPLRLLLVDSGDWRQRHGRSLGSNADGCRTLMREFLRTVHPEFFADTA